MSLSCECCMLSERSCVGLISSPEESYRLWCVVVCDREASILRRPWPSGGYCALKKNWLIFVSGSSNYAIFTAGLTN
jgi:hypothetical protein